jgi:large subunit ribosomal protein L13
MKFQKSYYPKADDLESKWVVVDAKGQTLGRVASFVASVVRGKNKPTYTPAADTGDFVIVVNASGVVVTGNKASQKYYHRHSGYPGGIKSISYKDLSSVNPARVLEIAIQGMLPKTKLGAKLAKKVRVYAGSEHPHSAQEPIALVIGQKEV